MYIDCFGERPLSAKENTVFSARLVLELCPVTLLVENAIVANLAANHRVLLRRVVLATLYEAHTLGLTLSVKRKEVPLPASLTVA